MVVGFANAPQDSSTYNIGNIAIRDFGPKPKILSIIIFTFPAVISEYLAKRPGQKILI